MNKVSNSVPFPLVAKLLGYGGVIPFVLLAMAIATGSDIEVPGISDAADKLATYAAVIISFIGAVHWGVALNSDSEHQSRLFFYSVVPALAAWLWLFFELRIALFGMAFTVVAMYLIDLVFLAKHIAPAYLTMRLHLTIVVAASLLLAAWAIV